MVLAGLENAFEGLLGRMVQVGNGSVKVVADSFPQSVTINGNGGEFTAWYSGEGRPVVAYAWQGNGVPQLGSSCIGQVVGGIAPSPADVRVCNRFIGGVVDASRKTPEVRSVHSEVSPARIPYLVAYFAKIMIPGIQ